MRLPLSWLFEYCEPMMTPRDIATRLAMTGTEVGRIHRHGVDALEHFVVGKVLTAEQHPNADRLRVCTVDVGDTEPAHIVCGAPNVAAGQTVAVARPGAIMPDGTRLKKAKLRGEPSEGMILAEDELAIGTLHAGTMVLDDGLQAGQFLAEVLPIATDVLELEITPNRPDCLAVYGAAREVHAATGAPLEPAPWEGVDLGPASGIDGVTIDVRDPDLCPRFTAVAYEGVTIAESPPWLKQRLMASGQRPINNVVDITNYVMLLTGQPVHAFDRDRIAGGRLVVRRANPGEEVTTLDDQVRRMPSDGMLIEDAEGPTSIAGIMGGARSEVSGDTTRVLLEMATWDGPNILATSNALGLRTEASARFEKGLSPEATVEAQAVALELMTSLAGATRLPGWFDVGGAGPEAAVIRLREARLRSLLGIDVPRGRQIGVLRSLGFGVGEAADGLDVTVPHWRRNDVTREADVIEEIARLAALEELPATLPRNRPGARLTWSQRVRRRAEDVLVGRGVQEIAGWSFAAPPLLDRLRLAGEAAMRAVVVLENPMSEDESILRPTLMGSLLDAARHNLAHGAERVALFDSGTVYLAGADDGLAHEHHGLGVVLAGPLTPPSWRSAQAAPADFFTAKALAGAVLDTLRVPWEVRPSDHWAFLHPGRAAEVTANGQRLGFVGELHPLVAREWDLEGGAAFALNLDVIARLAPEAPEYRDVTSFPPVRQDLSLVVDDRPAADVVAIVRGAGGALLRRVETFDRFERDGEVSLALHLEFAAPDRTLTDEEVARVREKILAALAEQGVTPRG
ncbi:phenylalanine--tRNA ligase subunit beta [Capillimicrobium parvum]|uniref:Phenylalanine--tRNA ligase beta subunit n=1 Tax=Capillimicrobium parvum TaxID=2884022 RepID=A0A9E6XXF7_9ACTN|nr:phenylalanine--tRNA ligase subunit beta [Capillimicrobium parvum]UGS36214.1 Phenylalanine--tRNA ligase beta subunit [Capillimicrobium parvum]